MNNLSKLQEIFFPVEKASSRELFGYSFPSGKTSCIFSPDKKKVLNVCSNDYTLISNESLFLPIYEEVCNRFGEDMIKVKVDNVDDRKFYVRLIINNRPYNIQPGDIVNPTIELQNSYDGTMKFSCSVGFHRVVCSNGMMAFQKELGQEQKHRTGGVNLERLFSVLDNVDTQLDRFKRLTDRRLTPQEVEQITETIREKTSFPKRLIQEVPEVIAREKEILGAEDVTKWLVYHGFNNRLNHAEIMMHQEFRARIDAEVLQKIELFN